MHLDLQIPGLDISHAMAAVTLFNSNIGANERPHEQSQPAPAYRIIDSNCKLPSRWRRGHLAARAGDLLGRAHAYLVTTPLRPLQWALRGLSS